MKSLIIVALVIGIRIEWLRFPSSMPAQPKRSSTARQKPRSEEKPTRIRLALQRDEAAPRDDAAPRIETAQRNEAAPRSDAAQPKDKVEAAQGLATRVGQILGAATACRDVARPRIVNMTDMLMEVFKASTANEGELWRHQAII